VCAGQEPAEDYNLRASQALEQMRTVFDSDFLLLDKGRSADEQAVVLVRDGGFQGYGYVDKEVGHSVEELLAAIKPQTGNAETNRIIQRFLSQYP
ncbi:hypothetical protein MOQ26_23535, partial [Stenotrophomonas maltophilia]|nr:hypothetical protein [Stenotrophomonas maltophilia]